MSGAASASGAVIPVAAAVFSVAAALRVRDLRPGTRSDRRGLAVALAGLAVGTTALTDPVYAGLTRLTGVANVGEPVARTALMACAVGVLTMVSALAGDAAPRAAGRWRWLRHRGTWLAAAVVVLWVCFVLGPDVGQTGSYVVTYADRPSVLLYLLVVLAFVGGAFLALLRLGLRMRAMLPGQLATSGALIAGGAAAGCLYVLVRLTGLVAVQLGAEGLLVWLVRPGQVLAALGGLLLVTGTLWPAARSRWVSVWRAVTAHVASMRLYVLWRDLVRLRPGAALDPDPGALHTVLDVRDSRWRLQRRVVELRDAVRALRDGPVRLRVVRGPAGSPEASRAAYRAAEVLAEVVSAAEAGRPVPKAVVPVVQAGATVQGDAAWWMQVADWYRRQRAQQRSRQRRRRGEAGDE